MVCVRESEPFLTTEGTLESSGPASYFMGRGIDDQRDY